MLVVISVLLHVPSFPCSTCAMHGLNTLSGAIAAMAMQAFRTEFGTDLFLFLMLHCKLMMSNSAQVCM